MKITNLSVLNVAALTLIFSAHGQAADNPATNASNHPNSAVTRNLHQTAIDKTANSDAATAENFSETAIKEIAPDAIIKSLYAAQKAGASPFFQTKNRALVDKYFRKDLADLIWKDAVDSKGEVGAIDFDPLYGSQDPQIKNFVIMETGWGGDSKFGGENEAVVQVTFKDSGKERMVSYQFERGKNKVWKIFDIHYRDDSGEVKLAEVLKSAMKK